MLPTLCFWAVQDRRKRSAYTLSSTVNAKGYIRRYSSNSVRVYSTTKYSPRSVARDQIYVYGTISDAFGFHSFNKWFSSLLGA